MSPKSLVFRATICAHLYPIKVVVYFFLLQGDYYLKDFQMDPGSLPSFTPTGDYRVDFVIMKKENNAYVQLFRMLWYATVYLS